MNISIDFDDTYTRDPYLWDEFVSNAVRRGHVVYCVTARTPEESAEVYATIAKIIGIERCVFTSSRSKRKTVAARGIRIDIWIDDNPDAIVFGLDDELNDGVV
jgi:acid phosphatase class B